MRTCFCHAIHRTRWVQTAFTDAGPAMDSLYRTYETAVRAEEAMAPAAFREAVGSQGLSSEWRVADG